MIKRYDRREKALKSSFNIYNCTVPNTFALTFDDGPNELTEKHIEFFNTKNVSVTFFFLANRLKEKEMLMIAKKAYESGHQIGSHSIYHDNMTEILANATYNQVYRYVRQSTKIFYKNLGVAPKYFRPPYGEITPNLSKILISLGFRIILWNYDSFDWYWESEGNIKKLNIIEGYKKLLLSTDADKSYLSLQHEKSNNPEADIERLNYIIDLIRMKDYNIVTVADCLNDNSGGYFTEKELHDTFGLYPYYAS